MMPILSPALLMATGLLGGIGLVFGLIVWLTVDGRVGDGYSFGSALVGGFRGWADDPEAPIRSPSSPIGGAPVPAEPEAVESSGVDPLEAVDLSPDDALPASRVAVHVALRGPRRSA